MIGFYDKCVALAELLRETGKSLSNGQAKKGAKKSGAKRKADEDAENENEEDSTHDSMANTTIVKSIKKLPKMIKEGKSFITLKCISLMFQDIFQE